MNTPVALVLGWLMCVLGARLGAALEFEQTEIVAKPGAGESSLAVAFKFKNTGAEPVTITHVQSGCGCTVPTSPKEPFAPGAEGEIPVAYKAGDRQGRQSQAIVVQTSDGKNFDLRLVVDLPVRVSFAPRMILFRGDEQGEKTAVVTYGDDLPVTVLEVVSLNPAFELVGEAKLEDGATLKITVRRAPTAAAGGGREGVGAGNTGHGRGMVRIRTQGKSGREHADLLYLRATP
jgi:Protein of unknown function (DUF1573)